MRMALDEITILKSAMVAMSGAFAWMFKRQIDRVDALEAALNNAAIMRAETHKDVKHLTEGVDALRIDFKAHMGQEERSERELANSLNVLNDKTNELAKIVAVLNDRMERQHSDR